MIYIKNDKIAGNLYIIKVTKYNILRELERFIT